MMKKKMRSSMDPAPSSSFFAGDEAMARFKHQYLLQDYQELLKETAEKRDRLQKAMQKKLKLLAEVKFLRKKYQSFTKTKQQSPYPVNNNKAEMPIKERNCKSKEASVQTVRKLIDLNQVFLPNDEDMDTFDVEWEQLKMDKLRLFEYAMADDLKPLSVCRDVGSGPNQPGKRKITWQDQLALRV